MMDEKIKNMLFSLGIGSFLSLIAVAHSYITEGLLMAQSTFLVYFLLVMPIMTWMMFMTWDVDYDKPTPEVS